MEQRDRSKRFTSSEVFRLIKKGKEKMTADELVEYRKANPKSRVMMKEAGFSQDGLSYIEEKRIEGKLGRGLSLNAYSPVMAWGHIMERVCFEKLEMQYDLVSDKTILHKDPELAEVWSGTPDYIASKQVISEQKSFQLKNFAQYTDVLMKKDIALFKEEYPKEYWQIVSNCCINGFDLGEGLSFMPYRSTLEDLIKRMNETDILDEWGYGHEMWKFRFITEKPLDELPWIEEGGHYKEMTRFRFVVPEEDKEYLTDRIKEASKLLKL